MSGLSKRSMRPIAAALAALFGLTSLDAVCAPLVTNCEDSGAGSLRQAVHDAADNDLLDLANLPCSEISLLTGAIAVTRDNLRIQGPANGALVIDRGASPGTNLITHYSTTGTLTIDHMTLSGGDLYMSSDGKYFGGGCVGSFGNLELDHDTLTFCNERVGDRGAGRGAGAFAYGNLTVSHSVVTMNQLIGPPYTYYYYCPPYHYCYGQKNESQPRAATMRGAGLFAKGTLTIDHTTISRNHGAYYGGGVYAAGSATISYSTFSDNVALSGDAIVSAGTGAVSIQSSTISQNGYSGGGFAGSSSSTITGRKPPTGTPQSIRLYNSTIANNTGLFAIKSADPLGIYNSTIAFNRGAYYYAGNTIAAVSVSNAELHVVSSIIADNVADDVQLSGTATITGSNNLINYPSGILSGTLSACPRLVMLNANGGSTKTLALRSTSPAVGAGSNPKGFTFDQRGTGFLRQFQTATDIGAFEWNGSSDDIFSSRFDGSGLRCDL